MVCLVDYRGRGANQSESALYQKWKATPMTTIDPAKVTLAIVNRAYALADVTGRPPVRTVGNVDSYLCQASTGKRAKAIYRPIALEIHNILAALDTLMGATA